MQKGHHMRRIFNPQLHLFTSPSDHPISRELAQISEILDANSQLLDLVYQNLVSAKRHDTGREGLTAEQVLRCAVLKQYLQLSYEELAFRLDDSSAFRGFSRLEMGQYSRKSILRENIKTLREDTWEAIHRKIIGYAQRERIETGKKIWVDSTAIEPDIHHPTNLTLLIGYEAKGRAAWLAGAGAVSEHPRAAAPSGRGREFGGLRDCTVATPCLMLARECRVGDVVQDHKAEGRKLTEGCVPCTFAEKNVNKRSHCNEKEEDYENG